jgi:hypothetical protein
MLFFFELLLFVLVMVTLALGEFVGRGWALGLWLLATMLGIGGYFLARAALQPLLRGQIAPIPRPPTPRPDAEPAGAVSEATAATAGEPRSEAQATAGDTPTPLDEKWARTLLYNWRRTNVLLLLGVLATSGWYWLGA